MEVHPKSPEALVSLQRGLLGGKHVNTTDAWDVCAVRNLQ